MPGSPPPDRGRAGRGEYPAGGRRLRRMGNNARMTDNSTGSAADLPPFAELVLDVIDRIPPGRVMTYGDVAEFLGEGGPRQVGRVLALYGSAVAWWRVVRADGTLLPGHEHRALAAYRAEGTPLKEGAEQYRLDMRRARWDGG
ncbi:MGMT family protein [Kitasatospora viridis]|uniref:Alkylated DNA nucleotide flippase Atl1 n=2 Tax=Kitasatospora viridis TaxID=281105 RepID=A0A561UFA8_9ACTN|nr:alkylated DNA nucleotide flippase Atl1 [Kitasatospora viridis]